MPLHVDQAHSPALGSSTHLVLKSLPADLRQRIYNLVQASADPARAAHYVAELHARFPQFLTDGLDESRLQWLITIFSFSRFLSEELLRRPEGILSIGDVHRVLSGDDYRQRFEVFLTERGTHSGAALELALFRRRELLRIVVRDALAFAALPELTEELSNLADAILDCALSSITSELSARYGVPMANGAPATFAVVALGKLGGYELNYSSDIDLLFLYSDNGETSGPEEITNKEFFKKVANRFTDLLSTYTAAGLCYRVDLRLRPEGTLGEVCVSLSGAEEYYSKRARDWELQMLIKARVAAGDASLGKALLDSVEPLIYSTTLDFSAIETMSATRERISEKLASKRLNKDGFDVKLARGGIRDIEFLVQCLQRLHGGRELWVRHGGTMLALSRLLDKDLLSNTEYSRLIGAYRFLRNLEHRLQFEDDRQTHTLPSNPVELERVAKRMPNAPQAVQPGHSVSMQLVQELNQHLESVQVIYDRIVYAQRPLYYTHGPSSQAAETAVTTSEERGHTAWSENLSRSLERAAPALAATLGARRLERGQRAFDSFLEKLLEEPQVLDLLNRHPVLSEYVTRLFELSPYLSEQLIRNPMLLEEVRLVADDPNRRAAFESQASPLTDVGALRRFFHREMVRIQAASVCLGEPVFQTLDRTSALAEFVIARAYRIALERAMEHARQHARGTKSFAEPKNELMVVALGRLGMREFDLGSDADLLFIIPDEEAGRLKFWTRVTEHLIDILTAYTGDGTILSLDTRLRPNGREGLLVQTESTYIDYFSTKAEAWEGIAYMKARAVAGNLERATKFLTHLQEIDWRRYGQSGRSRQDLRMMRARLEREQGQLNPLKAGSGGFYDADFVLMYLRLKGAGLFFPSLNTPERIDIVEKMGHLDRSDAEFLLKATTFFRALDHALRILTGQPQEKLPASRFDEETLLDLMERWTRDRPKSGVLVSELFKMQRETRRLFDRVFY